jgi:hypothetical protein
VRERGLREREREAALEREREREAALERERERGLTSRGYRPENTPREGERERGLREREREA